MLPGVAVMDFEERVETYMDNVVVVWEDEEDLLFVNTICRQIRGHLRGNFKQVP
jgi:hypothetical protein